MDTAVGHRWWRKRASSVSKICDKTLRKAIGPKSAVRAAFMKQEAPKLKKGRGLSSAPGMRRNGEARMGVVEAGLGADSAR